MQILAQTTGGRRPMRSTRTPEQHIREHDGQGPGEGQQGVVRGGESQVWKQDGQDLQATAAKPPQRGIINGPRQGV